MTTKAKPASDELTGNGNGIGANGVSKGKYTTTHRNAQAPHELKALPQWVAWKKEPDPDRDKPRKVPVNPRTGKNAATNRPSSWGTYEQAIQRAEQDHLAGIGFVFTAKDPYCGVDLDGCIDDRGNLKPWAEAYANELQSYTETSQSGTGLHVIVKATLPGGGRKAQSVEVYDRGRFFVWTGAHVPDFPEVIHERQATIDDLLAVHFGVKDKPSKEPAQRPTQPVSVDDNRLLELARNAANGAKFARLWDGNTTGYGSQSEADLALCAMLAFWTGGDDKRVDDLFRQSRLYRRGKWNERHEHDGRTYGKMTVDKALKGLSAYYTPGCGASDCQQDDQHEHAPDPEQWELTYGDWRECSLCAAWWHTTVDGRSMFYHRYCGRKDCKVFSKIRLRRMLSPALDWQSVFLAEVDERDYRAIRDLIDGQYISAPQSGERVVIATENPTPYSVSMRTETALEALETALATIPEGKRVRRRQVKRERPATPVQRRDTSLDVRLRPGELKIILAAVDVFGIAYRQHRATFQSVDPLTVAQRDTLRGVFDTLSRQPWGKSSIDTILEHTCGDAFTVPIDGDWPEPLPRTEREYRLDALKQRYRPRMEVQISP